MLLFAGLVGLGLACSAPSVEAAVITSNFTYADPMAGLGAGPYGTVTVTDVAGGVTIDVTLPSTSWLFVNTGDGTNHEAFAFNVSSSIDPADIILHNSTSGGFTMDTTVPAFETAGIGQFTNGIIVNGDKGASNGQPGPIHLLIMFRGSTRPTS